MERPNQPPDTECCLEPGKADAAHGGASRTNFEKRTQGTSQAVSGSSTPLKQSSLETVLAGGDVVASAQPNTEAAAQGEAVADLPGSKSMARAERVDGNLGGPKESRRAHYGSQAGRKVQRQEELSTAPAGVRSAHSSLPLAGQGADHITQPAQETRSARTADKSWSTSLRAIAQKAVQNKTHRFADLYRLLNRANLKECFYRLRKEAAPGVDGVTFEE